MVKEAFGILNESAKSSGFEPKDNPVSAIFSRDSYVKRPSTKFKGSDREKYWDFPWYEQSDLFASVLTTARYFPHEFAKKYSELKPDQQSAVKTVFEKELGALFDLNPKKSALLGLMPEVEFIAKKLGVKLDNFL